jgi:hypothetical protein
MERWESDMVLKKKSKFIANYNHTQTSKFTISIILIFFIKFTTKQEN